MARVKPKPAARGPLRAALRPESPLQERVCGGVQALERIDRRRLRLDPANHVLESLYLDEALARTHANEHRWDYLLSTRDGAAQLVGVEVHPARADQVDVVIRKKRAGEAAFREHAPGATVQAWYWVASGKTAITGMAGAVRRLALEQIELVGSTLRLPRT